jgi:hypothetical protein
MLFSLPPGTEMFHFPGFPPPALYIQAGVTPHHGCRVPPFGHPRINARLTAPRGLSRPPTSFIGSWYQGIHHAPFITYTHTAPTRGRTRTAQPHPFGAAARRPGHQGTTTQRPSISRCSHPLSSSQTPHEHPHPTGTPTTEDCDGMHPGVNPSERQPSPRVHGHRGRACSLRTQQCATPHTPRVPAPAIRPVPAPRGAGSFTTFPPMSITRRHVWPPRVPDPHHTPD